MLVIGNALGYFMKRGKWRMSPGNAGEVLKEFDDKKPFSRTFLARTITKRLEQTSFVIAFDIECQKVWSWTDSGESLTLGERRKSVAGRFRVAHHHRIIQRLLRHLPFFVGRNPLHLRRRSESCLNGHLSTRSFAGHLERKKKWVIPIPHQNVKARRR